MRGGGGEILALRSSRSLQAMQEQWKCAGGAGGGAELRGNNLESRANAESFDGAELLDLAIKNPPGRV